jgi:HK97 gp10 family phage protein
VSYKSRIPEIAAEIPAKLEAVMEAGAQRIAQEAKNRVPVRDGDLRNAIHVEKADDGDGYVVIAGNRQVFYGHLVEHGGAFNGARPFLVPAFEQERETILALGADALDEAV